MPPQTRSQRRQQAARQQVARQQPRPAVSAEATPVTPTMGATVPLEAPVMPAPAPVPAAARPARSGNRRVISRPAPEPIDYTKDYQAVRIDLRWIAIWTVLLFIAMFALRFSGLV